MRGAKCMHIIHLQFVEDTLIICEADEFCLGTKSNHLGASNYSLFTHKRDYFWILFGFVSFVGNNGCTK